MNNFKERKETFLKHLFDGSELNVYETKFINLSAGTPSFALLNQCCKLFKDATEHMMNYELENQSFLFQYGPQTGTFRFRKNLAEFLSKRYHSNVEATDLVLNGGATNGLLLILSTLIDLNGVVFVDEATYMIALESIKDFSTLKIVPVKLNDDGVDLDDLEEKVIQHKFQPNGKLFFACYYTIPTYHNPTSIVFSDEISRKLILLARKYDLLIACDDVYNLLCYDDEIPPKRLFAYDSFDDDDFKGNVISNGTFSKLLSPGARIGWMECSPRIVEAFQNSGFLKSGGAVNNYVGGIIASMIEMETAEQQLDESIRHYKDQRDALVKSLTENLSNLCSFNRPRGGYFIWLKLPEYVDGELLSEFLLKNYKVFIIKGSRFSIENKCKNYVRLSFAFQTPQILSEAGKLVCDGINEFLNTHKM